MHVEHTSRRRHGVSLTFGQAGRNALDEEFIVDEKQPYDDGLA
jgi:hypothetical protein